jgi:alpha-L-fucosidase
MKRRSLLKQLALSVPAWALHGPLHAANNWVTPADGGLPKGPFRPDWTSLANYKVPEWFRNAKFGIWAHWGPQCEPEAGDWYARGMYMEGSGQYKSHLKNYGHPSVSGFKEIIHRWKADQWQPEELVAFYKKAGARYFMALANHHDNFDLYNSRHHRWNSTRLGPQKDIIGGWAKAARANGLYFGASVHAAHAWSWFEVAQRSDKTGTYAGVPYDGRLTKQAGKGQWWEGLDPQELYAQNHPLSEGSTDNGMIHRQWDWGNGAYPPSGAYCRQFLERTIDLIDQYGPDMLYFDDTVLPLWPVSDVGLRIAAHFYNRHIQPDGNTAAVIFGKILNEQQRRCMVWDIERGQSNQVEPLPWQTDTCIGSWHYDRDIYLQKRYKKAVTVIHTLCDVVSKNGNLLLSVPVRGNGTIDELERAIVEEIGEWMQTNSEAIYDTRPWVVMGEGPAMSAAAPLAQQGFNEGKGRPFTAADIRFTSKQNIVYAILMGRPETATVSIQSLGEAAGLLKQPVAAVEWLGIAEKPGFSRKQAALEVDVPRQLLPISYAMVLKVMLG